MNNTIYQADKDPEKVSLKDHIQPDLSIDLTKTFTSIDMKNAPLEIHHIFPQTATSHTIWACRANVLSSAGGWSDTTYLGIAYRSPGTNLWSAEVCKLRMMNESCNNAILSVVMALTSFLSVQYQIACQNVAFQTLQRCPQSFMSSVLSTVGEVVNFNKPLSTYKTGRNFK